VFSYKHTQQEPQPPNLIQVSFLAPQRGHRWKSTSQPSNFPSLHQQQQQLTSTTIQQLSKLLTKPNENPFPTTEQHVTIQPHRAPYTNGARPGTYSPRNLELRRARRIRRISRRHLLWSTQQSLTINGYVHFVHALLSYMSIFQHSSKSENEVNKK
jgi:hypothetical protein